MTNIRSISIYLFLPLFFAVLSNLIYFDTDYFPVHDTLFQYQTFSVVYSHFFYTAEFPNWFPYVSFGQDSTSWILFSIGPTQLILTVIGWLANIENTLLLFNVSLTLDLVIFLTGSLLLISTQTNNLKIFFFLTFVLSLLVFYDRQIFWNFKIYIAMPYLMYGAVRLFKNHELISGLFGANIFILYQFGNISYASIPILYVVIIFSFFMYWMYILYPKTSHISFLKNIFGCKKSFTLIIILSIILCLLIYILLGSVNDIKSNTEYIGAGRDSNTLKVNLNIFLNYGHIGGPPILFELLNGDPTSHSHDTLAYAGLLTIPLTIFGIIKGHEYRNFIIGLIISNLFIICIT